MKVFRQTALAAIALSLSLPSHALDILGRDRANGGQGVRDGLVALYRFSSSVNGEAVPANRVFDESGFGARLDLAVPSGVVRRCDGLVSDPSGNPVPICYLDMSQSATNVVRSLTAATKIAQQCKASNSMTVEVWFESDRDDELTKEGRKVPFKMLTMGRNAAGQQSINGANRYMGSSNDYNFYFGLTYNDAAQIAAGVRHSPSAPRVATANDGFTSPSDTFNNQQAARYAVETNSVALNSGDSAANRVLVADKIQQAVFTYSSTGRARLYVSGAASIVNGRPNPFSLTPVIRGSEVNDTTRSPASTPFSSWNDNFYLGIGNELTHADNQAPIVREDQNFSTERRDFRGKIYLVAIYCDAHTEDEILGAMAPNSRFKSYAPNRNIQITPNHQLAAKIYSRLTGTKIPVTAPIISGVNDSRHPAENFDGRGMAQLIAAGDKLGAARLATQQDGFYNITVRDFAKRMSTRDETVNTVLNDMVATIIGVTRDNLPATQLLTGNFYYIGNPQFVAAPSNVQTDLLISNNHYDRLEALGYNLRQVLVRVEGQKISNGTAPVDHPDPAGILTSRAFLGAHAIAGTNRRIIEYAFREFACVPITAWADSSGPDNRVGKDVDRFPGGDNQKFLNNCRSCHSNMDGFRGAFARFHFNNNFVKHTQVITAASPTEDGETATTMCQRPSGVACKMNRNADVFEGGYQTVDDEFINNAYRGANTVRFGWKEELRGRGARSFGEMLSTSKAFPECMAKRVFRSVCKREPATIDQGLIQTSAQSFVNENYNLRGLFERIVVSQECLGEDAADRSLTGQ